MTLSAPMPPPRQQAATTSQAVADRSSFCDETGWQRTDRYLSYAFFAVFGVGGMAVPLGFMIYSMFLWMY